MLSKHAKSLLFDCIDVPSQSDMETVVASMVMRAIGLARLIILHEEPYHLSDPLIMALLMHHGNTLEHLTISEREGDPCEDAQVSKKLIYINRHCSLLRHLVLDGEFHLKVLDSLPNSKVHRMLSLPGSSDCASFVTS